ncbi:unnamed protein product, partial [Clonostachys chloroleuca]
CRVVQAGAGHFSLDKFIAHLVHQQLKTHCHGSIIPPSTASTSTLRHPKTNFRFRRPGSRIPYNITPVSRPTLYFGTQQLSHSLGFKGCAYPYRKQRKPNRVSHGYDPECGCPNLPKQLLCVCRSFHKEAVELLHGENKLIVRAHHQVEDLDILKTLQQSQISASDPELSTGNNLSESIIRCWTEICQRLFGIVIPGTLHLEFICDAQGLQTAQRVIEPMSPLPRLKECSIRLGRKKGYSLRSHSRSTALQLTRGVEQKKPPVVSFSSLPRELRLRILWFTNLGPGGTFLKSTDHELETIHVNRGRFAQQSVSEEDSEPVVLTAPSPSCTALAS